MFLITCGVFWPSSIMQACTFSSFAHGAPWICKTNSSCCPCSHYLLVKFSTTRLLASNSEQ